MNKKIGKIVTVSALALAITSAATAGPMAMGFSSKYAAKDYAKSIEALAETTGDAYEANAESYPDNAVNNPDAPKEYVDTCVKLGNNFLSGLFK